MTTIKTSELTGAALDWAVAKCEGLKATVKDNGYGFHVIAEGFDFSTDPDQAYPVIKREGISVTPIGTRSDAAPWRLTGWQAQTLQHHCYFSEDESTWFNGPTPLIAAMRCYVASKLGDTVEVPDELIQGAN